MDTRLDQEKTEARKMNILVNGEAKEYDQAEMNLRNLLVANGLNPDQNGIAVAVNLSVVLKAEWPETFVKTGDEVDIITARQGG